MKNIYEYDIIRMKRGDIGYGNCGTDKIAYTITF